MADRDANGAQIVRKKIVCAKDPAMYNQECTYMQALESDENSNNKKLKITSLYSVDLCRDVWQRHFPAVVVE